MKRPLLIRIARGSITQMKTSAIVVSHFQGVAPGGAEAAVDEALGGDITFFATTRSLVGALGDFFAIPSLASGLHAQVVVVMGLGPYDIFTKNITPTGAEASGLMRQMALRLIDGLLHLDVTNFATILIGGGGGGVNPEDAAFYLIEALCRAISSLDADRRINEFTIVEADPEKIPAIKKGCKRAQGKFKSHFQFEVRELSLPVDRKEVAEPKPVMYVSVRKGGEHFYYSVMTHKPVSVMTKALFSSDNISGLITQLHAYGEGKKVGDRSTIEAAIKETGGMLYDLLVPREVQCWIRELHEESPLILSLERSLAQIPWELMYDGELKRFLGELAMGRQITGGESFRQSRRADREINMLIIANPSGDLPEAQKEGEELKTFIDRNIPQVKADLWCRDAVPSGSRKSLAILKQLYPGKYEVVHYSGHAFYDPVEPEKSGWYLDEDHRDQIRAFEFSNLSKPPIMVFANACESGAGLGGAAEQEMPYGLAEAFIQAGVDVYVGTAWKVRDEPAASFAQAFYQRFLLGSCDLGSCLSEARRKVIERYTFSEPCWASYMLYGTPTFRFHG
jgi:CHAT domain